MNSRFISALCLPLLMSSLVFAQGTDGMPLSLRVYCHVSPFLNEDNAKCFGAGSTQSVMDDTANQDTFTRLQNELANLKSQMQALATTPKAPTIIQGIPVQESAIRYVYVKGEKGDTGATGQAGSPIPISAAAAVAGAFQYIPQPFWNGAGSSGSTGSTIINNTVSPLPTGGTLGQVLTINASGTPEWVTAATSSSTVSAWSLTGNAGTDSNINFIGTTDAQNLVFKTNNATTGIMYAGGDIRLGLNTNNTFSIADIAIGKNAGFSSSGNNGYNSTFIGEDVGNGGNAEEAVAIGQSAGFNSLNFSNSTFVGNYSGQNSGQADSATIIGFGAGSETANVSGATFLGYFAGYGATNAQGSLFLGGGAGYLDTVNNVLTGGTSILIGSGTRTGGFSNSIGLGSGAVNTATNQFLIAPTYTQLNMRGVNYTMPAAQGLIGTTLTNDGSGNLSWTSGGGSSTAITLTNGLTAYPLGIGLGGILSTTTTITQNGFNYESVRVPLVNTNSFFTIENKQRTVPLLPTFLAYNIDHAGAYSEKTYAAPTSIGFGKFALGTVVNRAGLQRGVTEPGVPYFDASNYIPLSDNTTEVHRINNNNYGPAMYYERYTNSSSTVSKRSYMQTRNDGGAYITGSDESLFTRADINANANGSILLRSSNFPTGNINAEYNSSVLGGIVLSHAAPGFNTTLTLSTTTGVTISNMLAVGTSSPLATLHIATTSASAVARFDNANGYCEINPTSASLICTSDRTLKKNITSLESTTLSKLALLNPVTYNWLREADGVTPQYGFIAQDVESIFPTLVYTNTDTGIKTLSYTSLIPITVQALKDLNLALGDFTATSSTPESFADSSIFKKILAGLEWMGVKIEKGIASFKTIKAETLCVGETCVTEAELKQLLQNAQVQGGGVPDIEVIVPSATTSTTTIDIPPVATSTGGELLPSDIEEPAASTTPIE